MRHRICASALLIAALAAPALANEAVELRGYGKISPEFNGQRVVFTCQSQEKARILAAKLRADLSWDSARPIEQSVAKVHGKKLTLDTLQDQGTLLIARSGSQVIVLAAENRESLLNKAQSEGLLKSNDVASEVGTEYPRYLDFFDLRAFKLYTHPMSSARNLGLDSHWPFLKQFNMSLAFQWVAYNQCNPAPGVMQWAPSDYEVSEAERHNGLIVAGPTGGGEVPFWVYNAYPQHMMTAPPTSLRGEWGGAGAAGAHYESWAMPAELRLKTGIAFQAQVMERYRNSPALGGWNIYTGSPGVEFGFHDQATRSWDHSADGQSSWRQWLRDQRRYSLADLGKRWYGDSYYFKNWNDITVPDTSEFFGNFGSESFQIHDGWQRAAAGSLAEPADSTAWIPVEMPPAQGQAFLPAEAAFFKTTFNADSWRHARKGENIWLVFAATGVGNNETRVWLNGKQMELPKDIPSKRGPFAVQVTSALKSGDNSLLIRMDNSRVTARARLAGPVFLTSAEPKRIPYTSAGANARYADFRDWQAWAMTQSHRMLLDVARKIDPDRPMVLSGAARETFDYSSQLAAQYQLCLQHTGSGAWYHPWWSGLGQLAGFYSTGEPGGTLRGDKLDRMLGWLMFEADSSVMLFWDIEDYINEEKNNAWFTRHQREIQLFGKYLREKPQVVIFRSAKTMRMGNETPWSWDIGRGELQAAHFDNLYATEHELQSGLVDAYPVMIDAGSEVMDEPTIAAIRRYVENGGTFIALHNTGRHSLTQADSFPIAALTGFRVREKGRNNTIRFGKEIPIFKNWQDHEFTGGGYALDYENIESARNAGIALEPMDGSAVPLATWNDGSVAIGYRKMKKGQMIVLGSTFWRNGKDTRGVWQSSSEFERSFFEQLLTDCGIQRTARATSADIWARKMVTKNGLQEWLLAFNNEYQERHADVSVRVSHQPKQVVELVSNRQVPFTYHDGWVTIPSVAIPPSGVRIFAMNRESVAAAIPVWWQEKTKYWKTASPGQVATENLPVARDPNIINMENLRFFADEQNRFASDISWATAGFSDRDWRTLQIGAWNLLDPDLKNFRGTGLYRKAFNFLPEWNNKQILLCLYSFNTPIAFDNAEFFINGKPVAAYKARGWNQTLNYDVTNLIQPGENILAVRVKGGKEFSGLAAPVWLEARTPLASAQDITTGWETVNTDRNLRAPAKLPGTVNTRYITRDITIPVDWKNRQIWLEFSSEMPSVSSVVINGQPINYSAAAHPFGLIARVNLTPYIKPGEENKLELWPFATMSALNENAKYNTATMNFNMIRIGVLDQ